MAHLAGALFAIAFDLFGHEIAALTHILGDIFVWWLVPAVRDGSFANASRLAGGHGWG